MEDQTTTETLHIYVVPEGTVPSPQNDHSPVLGLLACACLLLCMVAVTVFSARPLSREVTFTITVAGFRLVPVSVSSKTTVMATGKGYISAQTASGSITFYNGLTYTQVVPTGTRLTGTDGISVVTDGQAIIPPAAETTPPTYGQITVLAHAVLAGTAGNIHAGDINAPCCATSIIAQNRYAFTGGADAREYTYVTHADITHATNTLVPTLQSQALSHLPTPQFAPHCSTKTHSVPSVGAETTSALLTLTETCRADSYSLTSVSHAITTYSKRFGHGTLSHIQVFVVGVKNEEVSLYVVGQWRPLHIRRYWMGK